MTKKVYLAGPISGLTYGEAALGWREAAKEFLDNKYEDIKSASPMRGKSFLSDRVKITSQAYDDNPISTTQAVLGRDRNDVKTSDVVLMNLLGAKTTSIGTMVELGWADAYRVPVVLVMEKDGTNIHDHLFPKGLNTYWVEDLETACDLVALLLNADKIEDNIVGTIVDTVMEEFTKRNIKVPVNSSTNEIVGVNV